MLRPFFVGWTWHANLKGRATYLERADPQIRRPEAMRRAQQEETNCLAQASSKVWRSWARVFNATRAGFRPVCSESWDVTHARIGPVYSALDRETGRAASCCCGSSGTSRRGRCDAVSKRRTSAMRRALYYCSAVRFRSLLSHLQSRTNIGHTG